MKGRTLFIFLGQVPDGDPCDTCPRVLGRGGRRVILPEGRARLCYRCLAAERKKASVVIVER